MKRERGQKEREEVSEKERAEEEKDLGPPHMERDLEGRTMAAPFAGAQTTGKTSAP